MGRFVPILVFIAVGVAAIAVRWWWPTEHEAALPAAPIAEPPGEAMDGAQLALPGVSDRERAETPREEVQLGPQPALQAIRHGTTRLRMVHGITGEPLAGARVTWASLDRLGELGSSRVRVYDGPAESLLKEIGRVTLADELGRIELPAWAPMLRFNAQHGELHSDRDNVYTGLRSPETERYTDVLLFPRRTLEIQVVDRAGVPEAEVGVCLRIDAAAVPDGWTSIMPITKEIWHGVTQGELGSVRLEEADAHLRAFYEELRRGSPLLLFVDFRFPTRSKVAVRLDPLDWPPYPVQLVQPEKGALTLVVLDGSGVPTSARAKVYVDAVDSVDRPAMRFGERELARGRAQIEGIPYEVPLDVNVSFYGQQDPIHRQVDGPTHAQPVVELVIFESPPTPVVVGRLVDARGVPIEEVSLQVESRNHVGEALAFGKYALITPGGALEWQLGTRLYEAGTVSLRFSSSGSAATRELGRELTQMRIDLGNVKLEPVPETASKKNARGGQ